MKDFEQAFAFVIAHEAVYVRGHWGDDKYVKSECEKGDDGGLTKYGIDKRSHPGVDIEGLTLATAREIYYREWEETHCAELAWPLNQVHFDGCVNVGVGQQTKFIQRAAGVVADGVWGPRTKRAVIEAVNDIGPVALARHICDQKEGFYRRLAFDKPEKERFLEGWLNRLNDLRLDCGLLEKK